MMYRGMDSEERKKKQRVVASFIGVALVADVVAWLLSNAPAMRSLRVTLLFLSAAAIAGLLVYIFFADKKAA
jgi:hypothetical protein